MKVIDTYKTSYSLILNHQDIGKRTILNYQDTPIFPSYSLPKSIDLLFPPICLVNNQNVAPTRIIIGK